MQPEVLTASAAFPCLSAILHVLLWPLGAIPVMEAWVLLL